MAEGNLECAGQAQACLIRAARLDEEGAPLEGAGNLYVSAGLISMAWTPDTATGEELESINGCGEQCLYLRSPDRLRKHDLTLGLCAPEPELLEMLAAGTVHNLAGVTSGYGVKGPGAIVGPTDVSLELWEAIIVSGSIAGYARHVFPRTRQWRLTGQTFQNDVLDVELEGFGHSAGAWAGGPAGDWGDLSDELVDLYDWAIEQNELPEASCGAQELAIPSPS